MKTDHPITVTRQQARIDSLDRLDGIAKTLVLASRVLLAVLVAMVLLHR
jgi:hypothetical protein